MKVGEAATTRAGRILLAVVIPASALAVGSLLPIPLVACALGSAVACALLWWDAPARAPRRAAHLVLLAAAVLVGMTILQAIPLPAGLATALAPKTADIWARALTPLKESGPATHPLSLAPVATRENVLRGLFYATAFLGALRVSADEGGTKFLERLVVGTTVLVGFSAFLHPAVGAQRVFGLYRPRDFSSAHSGPLLNVNHLAAYMNIGACVAFGAALTRRAPMPRPIAVSATCALAGLSVWAASRGGTGSLVVGLGLVGLVTLLSRSSRGLLSPRRASVVVGILMVVAAAGLFGLGVSEDARADLSNLDMSKLELPVRAMRLVPLSPIFGLGRGAFESAFPIVRGGALYVTFTHPENLPAQWLTEWGVPTALVAGGLLVFALRPRNVLVAPHPATGPWAAVVAAALHDLVDFHLEVPAVVALLAVCCALVVGGHSPGSSTRTPTRGQRALRPAAFASAVGVVVAAPFVLKDADHGLADERERLRVLALDAAVPDAAFRAEIREAMLRYPAESYFPLAGAIHAQVTRRESVVPWVGRALETNPGFGRAHMVLARSLASRFRAQARLEYRLAYTNDVNLREAILAESPFLVDDFESAMELVVDGKAGEPMLERLAKAIAWRLPATAARIDRELLSRAPDAEGPRRRAIEAALLDVKLELPWCTPSPTPCLDDALRNADKLVASAPNDCAARAVAARVRATRGDAAGALDELASFSERAPNRRECLKLLTEIALEMGMPRHADLAVDRVVRAGCGAATDCADTYAWAAGVEEQRSHPAKALQLYKRALESAPERDDLRARVGDLATQLGMLREAADAFETLSRRHPEDASHAARAAELREEIARRLHER